MPSLTAHEPPGQLGQYRLLRKLGQGGMGTVYEAHHLHLQSTVAVKVLRLDRGEPGERVARFTREMAAIGRLVDPHVVRALDAGVVDGTHYLAMEFVDGCDAGRMMSPGQPLPVAEACEIARQGALGLAAIERARLVHRDIKPSNLLVTREGLVKIADLGLARLSSAENDAGGLTNSWQVVGTSDYMAPEQAEGSESLDIRTDLYSLGCTLFKLLSGHAPFESARHPTLPSKLLAHRQEPVPQLPESQLAIAPGLQQVLERMLAKQPSERWASPLELAEELKRYSAGSDLPALVAKWMPAPDGADSSRPADVVSLSGETFGSQHHSTESIAATTALPAVPVAPWTWSVALVAVIGLCVAGYFAGLPWLPAAPAISDPVKLVAIDPSKIEAAGKPPLEPREKKDVPLVKPVAPPPAVPADLDLEPVLQWQRLLTRSPVPLVWPTGRGLATWQWQEGLQQVIMTTDDYGLLALGTTNSDHFTLQFRIHQGRWSGGIGCFLGYRLMLDAQRRSTFVCQILRLQENVGAGGKQTFSVSRGTLKSTFAADGTLRFSQELLMSQTVPFPLGEQTCELTVMRGALETVRWNGQELRNLVAAQANAHFEPVDYRGPCGILVSRSSATVRDAQFMRLEGVR